MTGLNDFGNLPIWFGILVIGIAVYRWVRRKLHWFRQISGPVPYKPASSDDGTWWYYSIELPVSRRQWVLAALQLTLRGLKRERPEDWEDLNHPRLPRASPPGQDVRRWRDKGSESRWAAYGQQADRTERAWWRVPGRASRIFSGGR